MFENQKRKIGSRALSTKLKKLEHGKRWLFKAGQLVNKDYHFSRGLSSTVIKSVADDRNSAKYIYERFIARTVPQKETPALRIGSAFHKIVLEPKDFNKEFIVMPVEKRPSESAFDDLRKQFERGELEQANVAYWNILDDHNANVLLAAELPNRKRPTAPQLKIIEDAQSIWDDQAITGRELTKAEQKRIEKAAEVAENVSWWSEYDASLVQPTEGIKRPVPTVDKIIQRGLDAKVTLDFWAGYDEQAKDKTEITQEEYELIQEMKKATLANDEARKILVDALPEVSVFWRDDITDMICKARADALTDDVIYDLKSVEDISPQGFANAVVKYGYDVQAAYYMMGFCIPRFRFICVSKKPPFECAIYELDPEWLEAAHLRVRESIDRFNTWLEVQKWPSHPSQTIAPPKWYAAKYLGA